MRLKAGCFYAVTYIRANWRNMEEKSTVGTLGPNRTQWDSVVFLIVCCTYTF